MYSINSITVSHHFVIAHEFGAVLSGWHRSRTARPSLLRLNCGETRSMLMGSFVISAALMTC